MDDFTLLLMVVWLGFVFMIVGIAFAEAWAERSKQKKEVSENE
jgi:hypothetical protein